MGKNGNRMDGRNGKVGKPNGLKDESVVNLDVGFLFYSTNQQVGFPDDDIFVIICFHRIK